jgi:hypothetical protein
MRMNLTALSLLSSVARVRCRLVGGATTPIERRPAVPAQSGPKVLSQRSERSAGRLRRALPLLSALASAAAWAQPAGPAAGERCERVETGVRVPLRALWGASPDAVWAVGAAGVALRWNGVRWLQIPTGVEHELLAVGGLSAKEVWAVGQAGTALRFDGKRWREVPMGTRHRFSSVLALARDEVWAVGQDPGTHRWIDGAGGEAARESEGGRRPTASLFRWDGERWQAHPAGRVGWPPLRAASASAEGREIWVAGSRTDGPESRPIVARLRGERWDEEPGPGDLAAIFSLGEELIAAGPRGRIFARRQGGWLAVDAVDGAAYEGLWASGPKDIWAVGSQVRHFDGGAWTTIAPANGPGLALHAVWGAGPAEVWAVGDEGAALRCVRGPGSK